MTANQAHGGYVARSVRRGEDGPLLTRGVLALIEEPAQISRAAA